MEALPPGLGLTIPALIVGAAMVFLTLLSPRFSAGCLLTIVSVTVALVSMLFVLIVDCVPAEGVTCPTDAQRRVALAIIAGVTVIGNAATWLIIRQRSSQSEASK